MTLTDGVTRLLRGNWCIFDAIRRFQIVCVHIVFVKASGGRKLSLHFLSRFTAGLMFLFPNGTAS